MLQEQDRIKLDGIVQQMTANKEPDSNIQAVVNDFKQKYSQAQVPTQTDHQGITDNILNVTRKFVPGQEFGVGFGKSALSTLKGVGQIGSDILNNTVGRGINIATGKGNVPGAPISPIYDKTSPEAQQANDFLAPSNTEQKIGGYLEQATEYMLPSGLVGQGENAVNLLSKGITSPIFAAGARIVSKATISGVAAGAVKLAQTGGDLKAAGETALGAGVIRGGLATIGEGISALHLPERIYSTIFKNSSGDMLQQMKSGGLETLQRDNPAKFQEFVDAGIVHLENGKPILNESLAKQALDAGLRGSTRTMADTLVAGTLDSEHAAQQIAKGYTGTVSFPEKQFVNVLKDIGGQYQDVGFGEISDRAFKLAQALQDGGGELSASDALDMRRLFDQLRIASSFNTIVPKLSLTQSNFKALADVARGRVNDIPGMGDIMSKYSFQIEALGALAKEAARSGNTQVLSLIDSIFLSSGLSGGNEIPATGLALVRKYLLTPGGKTFIANLLNQAGGAASPFYSAAINALSGVGQSLLAGQ